MKKIVTNNSSTLRSLQLEPFDGLSKGPYYYHSLNISVFENFEDDRPELLQRDWGTLSAFLTAITSNSSEDTAGFSPWINGTSTAKTNAITALVIDFDTKFDINQLAPQFRDIERASYMARDPETGNEIFRVLLPLLNPISLEKFLILKPTIQNWADGIGNHPASNPSSYRVGRFCCYPSYNKADPASPRVEFASPGWMLDESAFDELRETGVLTLI
ncbi:hypothetical protein CAter282_4332 [Collimonas arenae]|uniref:Uncharacterized protein n=1 Tax=Collimonas arenae TaxID=279058 RepID=A0A127QQT9_9BURK|nr:hypothetical protein [Collimonas arenae]AMP02097.1 hypothetical protein CAter10_4707 [Collimonas arenae]AMP11992.1 hypothetical protein CAter282_4332 [Collimonas arenae]